MCDVPAIDPAVREALIASQRLGFLGERDIDEVIAHARGFVSALDGVAGLVADLGSGGGIPGLVIAHDRPDLDVLLVDRRSKRTDFLARMVRRLGWTDRVSVTNADVEDLIEQRDGADEAPITAAVARGFGPPESTLDLARSLVCVGGRIIISEPPDGDRWPPELLAELGVHRIDDGTGSVSVFETSTH